jgi:hypothetical protein
VSLSLFGVRVHIIALIHIAPFLSLSLPLSLRHFTFSSMYVALSIVWKKTSPQATVREKDDWLTDHHQYKNDLSKVNKWTVSLSRFVSALSLKADIFACLVIKATTTTLSHTRILSFLYAIAFE